MERMIYFSFFWFCFSLFLAFCYAPKAEGFKGESYRIVFFHVPIAWVSFLAFFISAYNSLLYLRKKNFIYDFKSKNSISLGILFTFLTTLTGAIFSKIEWGSYWNWDPRQISIVILFFIYSAYLILREAIENPKQRAVLSSSYALFSFLLAPFLIFVIPRVYFSLHPNIIYEGKIHMSPPILYAFLANLLSFTFLFFIIYKISYKIDYEIYKREFLNE